MGRYLKPDNPDNCISCNICLTACPVAKATRQYRGPKMTGPALSRLRKFVQDEDTMLKFCSNCKNCDRVCPSGVPISTLNMKARGEYYKTHKHTFAEQMLSNNEKMGKLMTLNPLIAFGANIGMKISKITKMLDIVGISSDAPLPSYAPRSFYDLFRKYEQPKCSKKVLFFPGCYVSFNEPSVGMDLVKVLNHNNVEVCVDERFVCCGSPMISAGYMDKVEQNALHNITILKEWAAKGYDIITTCTTCGLILKQEYEEFFDVNTIHEYSSHMYDSIEYLQMLHNKGEFNTNFIPLNEKVIYHTPCHLKVQGFGRPSFDILPLIPGVEMEDADSGCCGLSGIYGYKKDTAPVAKIIGSALQQKIKNSSAKEGVCECNICRLQMQNGTEKRAVHPLTIIKRAYGLN